jgi:orotate phosphoribosyltransferase
MQEATLPDPSAARRGAPGGLRGRLLELVSARGYERKEEPFLLSSGGYSHDYVDLRRAVARGEDLELAARAVVERLDELGVGFEAIGGMTMGADPVAHAVAMISGNEWFSVRKAPKGHGAGRRIEGADVIPGKRVVLFEDTVSTGGSILQALEVLRGTGAEIVLACTLLDRGDHASEQFLALEIAYTALLDYHDLGIEPIVPAPPAPAAQ